MIDAAAITIILSFLISLVLGVFCLMRRTSQIKRFVVFVLATFVITAVFSGCSLTNTSVDKMAVGQNTSLGQEEKQASEIHVFQEEQQSEIFSPTESPTSDKQELAEGKPVVSGTLKAHFINVGQADSILVQLPSGQNILIDGGNNDDGNLVVNYLKQQGVKRLDHVIGTHPHEDHIGGLDIAIKSFDVGEVYLPRVSHTTKTYEDLLLAIKGKGLKITQAKAGIKLDVGPDVEAVMLAPNSSSYEDLNNYSAVLKITYGSTSFLFTGDAEAESESEIIRNGYNLRADVLKVGHHGSHTSTTPAFLKAVGPRYAVISVGEGNDYGHPHSETLAKLAEAGVQVFRTDLQGTIVATSDGKSIIFNKKSSPVKERAPNTSSSNSIVSVALPASTSTDGVKIMSIDLSAEVVTIKNIGNTAVDVSGWKLVSEKDNQTFTFPSGTVIPAGSTLKVMSGPKAQAGSGKLIWSKSYIWNNSGDPGALYDSCGNLVSQYQ